MIRRKHNILCLYYINYYNGGSVMKDKKSEVNVKKNDSVLTISLDAIKLRKKYRITIFGEKGMVSTKDESIRGFLNGFSDVNIPVKRQ